MNNSLALYSPDDSSAEIKALEIEVNSFFQIPSLQIVGLPNLEIQEAKERIRSAILASGLELPRRRILVNLIPAHLKKRGTGWDLGIALKILASHSEGVVPGRQIVAWAELGLNGEVRSAGKTLRAVKTADRIGADLLILSIEDQHAYENCKKLDPSFHSRAHVFFASCLKEANDLLMRPHSNAHAHSIDVLSPRPEIHASTPNEIRTHSLLPIGNWWKTLIGISISGAHSVMLLGSKGSGKSSLIRWFQALQRPSDLETRISNLLRGELREPHLMRDSNAIFNSERPFRRPSSLIRPASLIGKLDRGHWIPGELAVCDGGYLISDEFLEWPRDSREILRGPLESNTVQLERGAQSFSYKTAFTWLSTANLCPCGEWTPTRPEKCRCSLHQRKQYLERLSGPILDRIGVVQILGHGREEFRSNSEEDLKSLEFQISECQNKLRKAFGNLPGMIPDHELHLLLNSSEAFHGYAEEHPDQSYRSLHQRGRVALTSQIWSGRSKLTATDFEVAKALFSDPFQTC